MPIDTEHSAQDERALVDAPAREELLGGRALELHPLARGRPLCRVEVDEGRLASAP